MNYENFDIMITQIFNIFEYQNFCKKTRLFSNVIYMLFTDLIQVYKVFYVLVTEVLERFPSLPVDQSKKVYYMYQNFVDLTEIMKNKADKIMVEFKFHVQLPQYYTPEKALVETLKVCIENKQSQPQNLEKISQQIRGGMDRSQFNTISKTGVARDPLYMQEGQEGNRFKEEDDSDSGEDFDYGDEADPTQDGQKNIDLLDYISNMDLAGIQGLGQGSGPADNQPSPSKLSPEK